MYVRLFSDSSLLALKYADMVVALGIPLVIVPRLGLDLSPTQRPMLDDDGWQLVDRDGRPRSYDVPNPWHRHQNRICVGLEGPFVNVCCGSPADADRVITAGVRNTWIVTKPPSSPPDVDPGRGYDSLVTPLASVFDAWDDVARVELAMVVPGAPGHDQRLREALLGQGPF